MRVANRIASALLGLALVALGLLAVAEVVLELAGRPPLLPLDDWYERLTRVTYAGLAVRLVSIGLIVLGVLILLAELRRWRPTEVDLRSDGERGHWRMRRRSLEDQISGAVNTVVGVHEAHARALGGEHRWKLRVEALADAEQVEQVRATARRAMDVLAVPSEIPLIVDVRRPRRVA
ncbi:MAG TPA: hypothetical protein VFC19_22100 [Candidatus Limnocylindrales bacterium]|nr:hypothetical protein [Candidatus Limnocylindrales bacterium]